MTSQDLRFADLRYDCIQCGASCTWGLEFDLKPATVTKLKQNPVLSREGYQPIKVLEGQTRTISLENGSCSFFNQEQLCDLHSELGFEHKPVPCQMFPFVPVETPDGFDIGVSFYCSAVQQNTGRPLSEHRSLIEQILPKLQEKQVAADPKSWSVRVDSELVWDWQTYRQFEARVIEVIRAQPLASGLFGLFQEVTDTGRLAFSEVEPVLRQCCASLLATVSSPNDSELRVATFEALLATEVNLTAPVQEFLTDHRRYLEHLVFRKFLTRGNSQLQGRLFLLILISQALAIFTDFEAAARGAHAEGKDLYRAFEIVEETFYYKLGMHDELALAYCGVLLDASRQNLESDQAS